MSVGKGKRWDTRAVRRAGLPLALLLTLSRVALVPVFVGLALPAAPRMAPAVAVFLAAALTDSLDGIVARRRGEVSRLGALLDPVADKLLVAAGLGVLLELGRIPAAAAVAVIAREVGVTGLRLALAARGRVLAASPLGKGKTVLQVAAMAALLLEVPGAPLLLWPMVGVTLVSGVAYVVAAVSPGRAAPRGLAELDRGGWQGAGRK